MKLSNTTTTSVLISSVALLFLAPTATCAFYHDAATSEELVAAYPALESDSTRAGNPLILCPFLRMLERSGRLDDSIKTSAGGLPIRNGDLKDAVEEFGCDSLTACGPVIDAVSGSQASAAEGGGFPWTWLNPFGQARVVDLERLWDAPGISHDCGLTFEPGAAAENGVSAARLQSTLASLAGRADQNNGQLVYQDILDTQNGICAEEGATISSAGSTEGKLIFAYLGGVERGFVDYSDVEGFLQVNNQMPLTKAANPITPLYLLGVN